ncbi:hypothetical protein BDD12DRAFT_806936 [Trichophaea hybrida]|nr:hypothetical protein BDD12DRAFT_806936 [Trichophaea hybrida]
MASQAPEVDLGTDDAFYALHHYVFTRDSKIRGTGLSNPHRDIDNYLHSLENIPELQSTPNPIARADRVRLLLDAFVKICQPNKGEILALSLALRLSAGSTETNTATTTTDSTDCTLATVGKPERLIFNIAGNGQPPPGLTKYLGGVWNRLKEISVLEQEARTKGGHPDVPESNTGGSPPAVGSTKEAQSQLIKQLHHDIHSFCLGQTRARLRDFGYAWNSFFPVVLSVAENTTIGGNAKIHNLFAVVCCALNIILNGLSECNPEFVKAHADLWGAYWELAGLGCDDHWYDDLEFVQEFSEDTWPGFSLRQIIRKAKKLNAHIQTVLKMTFSPRMRPWLECKLDVNLVNSGPRRLPFPTQSYLEACVRKMAATADLSTVYDQYTVESKEKIEKRKAIDIAEMLEDIPTVLRDIGSSESKLKRKARAMCSNERLPDHDGSIGEKNVSLQQMKPHAECALLAYLHQSSEPGVQRFSYIAVTKLSCFSCWLLFEAYRKHEKGCFIVRGCHSDTSHPWVIPDFKKSSLEEACREHILKNRIFRLFALHLKRANRTRKDSHSSVGSDPGPDDLREPVDFESCEANGTPYMLKQT